MKTLLTAVLLTLTFCNVNNLVLEDVSCNPPHGGGPDGRVWAHITCGGAKTPAVFDWQICRLSNNMADVFVWDTDPSYAYVEGESGSYQIEAHTAAGVLSLGIELPLVSCEDRK